MTTTTDKRQHNLELPISRIPNEILSEVFCDVRSDDLWIQPRHFGLRSYGRLKYWITVTHVCHAWREIALDTSVLWCYIDFFFNKPETQARIPELIRRSKQSPLSLMIGGKLPEDSILDQVKMHFGRVRDLVLSYPNEDTLQEVFLSQFQNLEALEIYIPYSENLEFILNDAHVRSGCIRNLSLSCLIDWKSKFLQGLTRLQLTSIPNVCKLGCHEFLLVLSKIPRLESLDLDDFIYEDNNFMPTKVHLAQLRELSVQCPIPEMTQFLPCLVIPLSCKLYIKTGNTYDEICSKFRAILSWLSNQLCVPTNSGSNASEQYIRSFHLLHDCKRVNYTVKGFSNVLSHKQMESAAADPILEFVIRWNHDDHNSSFNLETFLSLLPLEGLVSLGVVADYEVYRSPELWTVAFGSIQTLKEVSFNTRTSTFWEALARTNGDNNNNSAVVSLSFPALSSITVDDFFLESQPILDTLLLRSELGGTQLQSLVFVGYCRVPPEQVVAQLGELVSCVRAVRRDADRMPEVPSGQDSFP